MIEMEEGGKREGEGGSIPELASIAQHTDRASAHGREVKSAE